VKDDLLGCECLKAKESATSSNSNPSEKVSNLSLDDSDSDDERPNFVAASQYDPAPVSILSVDGFA